MIYTYGSDMHMDMRSISLYASPNFNAKYRYDDIAATKWDGDYPVCTVCGRTHGNFAVHHEPPRSRGSLLLMTPRGQFVVKPTLLLLCDECHRERHDKGTLSFRWTWNTPEDMELYLSGELFAHGYREHDERFFEHGRLLAKRGGYEWEVTR